jgi:hypothetical protein
LNDSSDVERAEAVLWEAIFGFSTPGTNTAQSAAAAVRALAAYRAALEAQVIAREMIGDRPADQPRHRSG